METYHSDVIVCFIWEFQETSYRSANGTSWTLRCITETSWWRTAETSLGASFETCFRRCGNVLMGRRHNVLLRRRHDIIMRHGDVPLRRLGDAPVRRRWAFHLRHNCDVAGTYRETSLRRHQDVLLPGGQFMVYSWSIDIKKIIAIFY